MTSIHTSKPKDVTQKEWDYACQRSDRAKRYAEMFGMQSSETVTTPDRFQDPVWQWENEVRGRFGGVVGGNLKE
jgi:hypothetical protein